MGASSEDARARLIIDCGAARFEHEVTGPEETAAWLQANLDAEGVSDRSRMWTVHLERVGCVTLALLNLLHRFCEAVRETGGEAQIRGVDTAWASSSPRDVSRGRDKEDGNGVRT